MKKSILKNLIKSIIKESNELAEYALPVDVNSQQFGKYFYGEFYKVLKDVTKGVIQPQQGGVIGWRLKGTYENRPYRAILATPFWESSEEITIELLMEDGKREELEPIPFPSKNWTMEAKTDAKLYIKTVGEYLQKNIAKSELKEQSSTGGVVGYSTPNAFTNNKNGSKKGTEAAEKYGTVVKTK